MVYDNLTLFQEIAFIILSSKFSNIRDVLIELDISSFSGKTLEEIIIICKQKLMSSFKNSRRSEILNALLNSGRKININDYILFKDLNVSGLNNNEIYTLCSEVELTEPEYKILFSELYSIAITGQSSSNDLKLNKILSESDTNATNIIDIVLKETEHIYKDNKSIVHLLNPIISVGILEYQITSYHFIEALKQIKGKNNAILKLDDDFAYKLLLYLYGHVSYIDLISKLSVEEYIKSDNIPDNIKNNIIECIDLKLKNKLQ